MSDALKQDNAKSLGPGSDFHDPEYVSNLFDRMASTYGILNYITSFGFSERWRKQCVEGAFSGMKDKDSASVYDLMSGMGEAWPSLFRFPVGSVLAIDLSDRMCEKASRNAAKYKSTIKVLQADALGSSVPLESADVLVCCFGLKTLSPKQRGQLATRVREYLKPGGQYSFVEISSARGWWLGPLYRFYLLKVIPVLGRLFGGDPVAYGMLGVYTERFGNCEDFAGQLKNAGLSTEYSSLFWGCASMVTGSKPG